MDAIDILEALTTEQAREVTAIRDELQALSQSEDCMDEKRACYLGTKRERTRTLGERLDRIGGFPLMLVIHESINFRIPGDGRELDVAWHGIGTWEG